jgi:tRNA pseudouridine55 synthase
VVLAGRATRLAQFLVGFEKEYSGTIRLGETTTTDDSTGETTATTQQAGEISDARIREAMGALTGRYAQQPPLYSAKKVGGQRAYRRARRGETFALDSCEVEIHRFQALARTGTDIRFACRVSSGTYVRALARDLGSNLGCGAHLVELRRESVGPYRIEDAVQLHKIGAGLTLSPMAGLVTHLPSLQLDAEQQQRVLHGRSIPWDSGDSGPVALLAGARLLAVAERRGEDLRPRVVLAG